MWFIPVCLVLTAGVLIAIIYLIQDGVIFPATRELGRAPDSPPFNWTFEDVRLDVGNGDTSHGWYVPFENHRGVVLFSHGNAGNIADRLESINLLRRLGFSVFAYDYGGYGRSSGRPSEQRVYRDVLAAWHYLTEERGIAPNEILLFGRSLGGAATAYLASRVTPRAVVLESTFTSIPDVARSLPMGFLLAPFIRYRFPSKERVPLIKVPLLIIHSPEDQIIPYAHGKHLYETATAPKQFLEIRGDHNDGFVLSMDAYLAGWESFLQNVMPQP